MRDKRQLISVGTGAILAMLVLWLTHGRFPLTNPIISHDIDQHRINTALPILQDGLTVEQDFVARHHGLTAVSLTLLKYDQIKQNSNSFISVSLRNEAGEIIEAQTVLTESLSHNEILQLSFDPLPASANQRYTLTVSGGEETAFSIWGYDLDVYEAGQVVLSDATLLTPAQDLQFNTQYQLTPGETGRILSRLIKNDGLIVLLALFVLPLPGALALLAYKPSWRWDIAARWGTALALGTALWPLIWFYSSLLTFSWTKASLWLTIILGWSFYFIIKRSSPPASPRLPIWRSAGPGRHYVALTLLLTGTLLIRLLTVRDMAFPLWVDASRHALITAVMVQRGQVITNYEPFLSVTTFPYHFGFHTLSSTLMLLGNFQLERLLLIFGQLLNALVPLSIYTAVWFVTRRHQAALFAAFLVAFPFFLPGYYATWGRFTQLTGMIIMPVLLVLSWLMIRGAKVWRSAWWLVGILAAGLFLIHFRVFLLYLPFAGLIWLLGLRKNSRRLELAGALTVGLIGIRAWTLFQLTRAKLSTIGGGIPHYNDFPTAYFMAGWDQYFVWTAAALLPFVLIGLLAWRQWGLLPIGLILWAVVLFAFVGGDFMAISTRSIVNLNSMYIILFVPLALYFGILIDQLGRVVRQLPAWMQTPLWGAWGAACLILLFFGTHLQIEILNPATILARSADAAALDWLDDNVPPEATFAVSSWLWLGNTYAGQDGGAWIVPLTGRQSSTPPADYIYEPELLRQVNGFNEAAVSISDWSAPETAAWLKTNGMTHIFVGAEGGFIDPSAVARNPNVVLLYGRNGTFIFGLK